MSKKPKRIRRTFSDEFKQDAVNLVVKQAFGFRHGKYLRDTHKPEAILLSLTPLVFERFLPSLTLWLSPNCPWMQANSPIDLTANFLVASFLQLPETSAFGCWNCKQQL